MRAAWWWIDRWRKSSAYIEMSLEEQGLYRNLLDAVWLFDDGIIPDDSKALITASGGDPDAWTRSGEKVLQWMQRKGRGWTNTTAFEVKQRTAYIHEIKARAGAKGGAKFRANMRAKGRADARANARANARAKREPPSPSTSLIVHRLSNAESLDDGGGVGGDEADERANTRANDQPTIQPNGARKNPLMDDRQKWETECLTLTRKMAEMTGEDAVTVMQRAAKYEGATRSKLNPASMTDDRLMNTVLDLRADVVAEEKKRGAQKRRT